MLRSVLYWIHQKRWLLFAAVLGFVLFLIPHPADLSIEGYRTLIITVMVVILIIIRGGLRWWWIR